MPIILNPKALLFASDNLIDVHYVHLLGVFVSLIATALTFKAYRLFGSKTRKWFGFTVLGFLLLALTHFMGFFLEFLNLSIPAETIDLVEHIVFFVAILPFIVSFYLMNKSFSGMLVKQ